jgi:SAM-dependent methyltransferase
MRDELILPAVAERLGLPDSQPSVLEVGSGYGHELAKFAQLGVPELALTGVELMSERIERAGHLYPSIRWVRADAESLPFDDGQFDLTCQFLALSNGLTREAQRRMASEMVRVTRPGGSVLWWDLVPTEWRHVRARMLTHRAGVRGRLRNWVKLVRDLASSSRRRAAVAEVLRVGSHYLNPVPADEIPGLFPGCATEVRRAGVDWVLWESIWPSDPASAERLFRSARYSVHALAIVRKPQATAEQ